MYRTRKEINNKLKRAFTNDEQLAVLVWSRETETDIMGAVASFFSEMGTAVFPGRAGAAKVAG